ncbi:MAG: tyrosine-type recombinase/integrase [Anaerolineae bacterium]|nr:tyrosine-type recombinase/integrase [Anaerolineae bacterium]NUQ06381.1 tyrosine-type recombinase/integrase [Anaerolineae bacterium]
MNSQDASLKQVINLFLGAQQNAETRRTYQKTLHLMRDHLGPARLLTSITPQMLVEFFNTVIYPRDLAPATVQKHIKTIKTFFNWSVNLDILSKSPARAIKGKKLPPAIDRSKAMQDSELAALLDAVTHKPRDYALILWLADTGARRGGAAGLMLADVDFMQNRARVTEKGGVERTVAFGEDCARAIRYWLGYRSMRTKRLKGTYVFSQDGGPMRAENVSLVIRRAAKLAGTRVLSSHTLRHRKGHDLADAHVAPSIAATALGHSDPMITLRYYYPADWDTAEKELRQLMTDPRKLANSAKISRFG